MISELIPYQVLAHALGSWLPHAILELNKKIRRVAQGQLGRKAGGCHSRVLDFFSFLLAIFAALTTLFTVLHFGIVVISEIN
jgi:hypothetical protein